MFDFLHKLCGGDVHVLQRGLVILLLKNFFFCAVHFEIYVVHSPTNALFFNSVKKIAHFLLSELGTVEEV